MKMNPVIRFVLIEIIIIMAIISIVQYVAFYDVNYSISLKEKKVEMGENVTVFYKVTNGLNEPVNNVTLTFWLNKEMLHWVSLDSKFDSGLTKQGSVKIPTKELDSGEYRIYAYLNYTHNNEAQQKELSLIFEIF